MPMANTTSEKGYCTTRIYHVLKCIAPMRVRGRFPIPFRVVASYAIDKQW